MVQVTLCGGVIWAFFESREMPSFAVGVFENFPRNLMIFLGISTKFNSYITHEIPPLFVMEHHPIMFLQLHNHHYFYFEVDIKRIFYKHKLNQICVGVVTKSSMAK